MKEGSTENIKLVFLSKLSFSIFELIGGIFINSVSIVSEAVRNFGNCISNGMSYYFESKSKKQSDNKYTYGYLRYSLISALITSFILLTGAVLTLYTAIPRVFYPKVINYNGMLIFAFLGMIFTGYSVYKKYEGDWKNVRVVSLHMFKDVLGWGVILLGSLFMKILNSPTLDSLLSIGISSYILYNVYDNIKGIMAVFMEKIPDDIDVRELKKYLKNKYENIIDIHHLYIWTIDGINNYITMHLVIDSNANMQDVIELKYSIKDELGHKNTKHVTIEIEYAGEKHKYKSFVAESDEINKIYQHQ